MRLLDRILTLPEFVAEPPVLVEIGASGGTHTPWKPLAKYSLCLAFDPDSRVLQPVHDESKGYRRLIVIPAAAVADEGTEAPLYLTRSPYCSSLLRPNAEALADWDFARLFDVERMASVPCVCIGQALVEAGITRVDWFKTDSQGLDLRLFQSLDEALRNRILAVEFEPGLIDAYHGEDKMPAVLSAMDRPEFWLADLRIRGTLRISPDDALRLGQGDSARLTSVMPKAPGWGEMVYLNTLRGAGPFSKRDWLLAWVIAMLHRQFGFALDLAQRGRLANTDPIFDELRSETERVIREGLHRHRAAFVLRDGARRLRTFAGRFVKGWRR